MIYFVYLQCIENDFGTKNTFLTKLGKRIYFVCICNA